MPNNPTLPGTAAPAQQAPAAPAPDVFADAFAASQAGHPVSTDVKGSDAFATAFSDSVAGRPVTTASSAPAQPGVLGPGTALGTPVPPEWSQEASGVGDILHGNIKQGAGKILSAETPHVIQGSWLEKAIQKVDPTFQGGVTNAQVKQYQDNYDMAGKPLVDVASGIDKQAHPIGKAVAETVQSMLTPESIAILASTGGFGLVDSPAALGQASRLISGGFSALAVANAYKHLAGFKKAFDAGDGPEATYQLTHGVLSGALSFAAARDFVGKPLPFSNPFINKVSGVDAVTRAVNPTVDVAGETFNTRPLASTASNEAAGTQAVRNIAQQTSEASGGLPVSQASSLRDIWSEPIAAKTTEAKTYYKQLDDASDNAWTANQNALSNVRRDIRMKGGIDDEYDAKLDARKAQLEQQQNEILDKLPSDVADNARSAWTAKSRLEDLRDIFQKKSNVSGARPEMAASDTNLATEQYNFKNVAKDLNAMDPEDLTKALGSKQAAQDLVTSVNLAAKQAWTSTKTAKTIFGLLRVAGLVGGYEGAKKLLGE